MMTGLETNFSGVDWGIVGCYLLGTVAVGLYFNRFHLRHGGLRGGRAGGAHLTGGGLHDGL